MLNSLHVRECNIKRIAQLFTSSVSKQNVDINIKWPNIEYSNTQMEAHHFITGDVNLYWYNKKPGFMYMHI